MVNGTIGLNAQNSGAGERRTAIETIMHRTSIRSYTSERVSAEDIETILRAGMAAPSAMNYQPWSFVVVTEREKLDAMAEMNPHAKMLSRAPLAIVVCGEEKWNMHEEISENPYWQQDCSAVTENILLAVDALGLGAVWTGCYPRKERAEAVSAYLGLPEGIQPLCVIVIGHPAPNLKGIIPEAKDKWNPEKIHYEKW